MGSMACYHLEDARGSDHPSIAGRLIPSPSLAQIAAEPLRRSGAERAITFGSYAQTLREISRLPRPVSFCAARHPPRQKQRSPGRPRDFRADLPAGPPGESPAGRHPPPGTGAASPPPQNRRIFALGLRRSSVPAILGGDQALWAARPDFRTPSLLFSSAPSRSMLPFGRTKTELTPNG